MSTKTTFKRIALVAVAALGFGVLTSVAPASATAAVTALSAGTSSPARVGISSGKTNITVTNTTGTTLETITAQIAAAPATSSTSSLTFSDGTTSSVLDGATTTVKTTGASVSATASSTTAGIAKATYTPATGVLKYNLNVLLNADIAGTYTILVTAMTSGDLGYAAGLVSTSYTLTTAGTPTTVTTSKLYGTPVGNNTANGAVLAVSLKDAAGNATVLGLNEALAITHTAGATTTLSPTSLGSGSSQTSGAYVVYLKGTSSTADGTDVVTVTGDGILPKTLISTLSVTTVAGSATLTGTFALTLTTGYVANTAPAYYNGGAKTSHGMTFTPTTAPTTDTNYAVDVTLASGTTYGTYVTVLAAATSGKISIAAPVSAAQTTIVSMSVGSIAATTVKFQTPVATTSTVVSPGSGVTVPTAGSLAFVAQLKDQFAVVMANQAASVVVSGRNTVASTVIGVTDATGYIAYTLKDAGTTGTSDSVVFTIGGVAASAFSVTYGTLAVGTLSLTGGSTTANVTAATPTISSISAGDTPEGSAVDVAVTVKDANSSVMIGVPVTFSVSGTGVAITTSTATLYTGSTGKVTAKVYAWQAGTYIVTATAGGKTTTGSYTFANSTPEDARIVSATVSGANIVAKVVDRFGNPVKGVIVYATKKGDGFFGTGATKTYDTTTNDGTVEFGFSGVADVTVSTIDYRTNSLKGSGQTCARAGAIGCADLAADDTAFTASTVGTALKDSANIGSSYAPAGVASATVSVSNNAAADNAQAASDAAAEATDAANAATDAANAAAEAADAATAAAQDAADAVAALSVQVSEQIAALRAQNDSLRKQLIALTNLIIKIQKKVKA